MLLVGQLTERLSWKEIIGSPAKLRCECKVLLVPGPPEVDVFDQVFFSIELLPYPILFYPWHTPSHAILCYPHHMQSSSQAIHLYLILGLCYAILSLCYPHLRLGLELFPVLEFEIILVWHFLCIEIDISYLAIYIT